LLTSALPLLVKLTVDTKEVARRTMDLTFEFDTDRTVGAILYLASRKIPDLTKWKLCKLLYLADRLHLARYGRPITGDVYYALPHGPIPSYTLDALNDDDEIAMELVDVVQKDDSQKYPTYSPAPGSEAKWQESLSTSDTRALDEIIEKYGHTGFRELGIVVDKTAAYRKAWAKRKGARSLMKFEDFFEDVPGARPDLLEELLDNRQIHHALQFEQ
jgi:uncharacterized phage-associated protein